MSPRKITHYRHFGRELAMQFLFQFDMQDKEAEEGFIIRFFSQLDSSGEFEDTREYRRGKKYASQLIRGITGNIERIDGKIGSFISGDWSWKRIALVDKCILRVAVYEMLFEEKVPPVVAINEAVELAKKFADRQSKPFINGLLNSVMETIDRDPKTGAPK